MAQETLSGELDRLLEEIEGADHPVVALAAAHRVGETYGYVAPDRFIEALGQTREAVDDPLVSFALHRLQTMAQMQVGQVDDDGDPSSFARESGCLVDWSLVGPFENASMQGFYDRLEPEEGRPGPYPGRLVEVTWRELSRGHFLCRYQLNTRVHPATSAVVYLSTAIESDQATAARLLIGSHSAYRVWLNGEPLAERTTQVGLGIDAEGWDLALREGENHLVVKLASTGQGRLSVMARLVSESAEPFDGWRASGAEAPRVDAFPTDGEFVQRGGARSLIEEGIAEEQPPEVQVLAARLYRELYSDDSSTPWRNVAERLLERVDELTPWQRVILAELFEEHWQRQALLDGAVTAAEAGDPQERRFVAFRRAMERGQGLTELEWEAQRRELDGLLDEAPGFLLALEALSRWYERHEGWPRAHRTLARFQHDAAEELPAYLRLSADLEGRSGARARAAELRRQAAEYYRISGTFGWHRLREEVAEGRMEDALTVARGYSQAAPWMRSWAAEEVQILRSDSRLEEALMALDAQIEEAPQDPALRERRAELLLVAGDRDGALNSLEEALALQPQATRLLEYMEHLQPASDRFYEPWIVDDLREIAASTPAGPHDYDHLVEQRVHRVASNGLSRHFVQRAHRVIRDEGIDSARALRIPYRQGDERIEVLGVRVHKADGTLSEDFRQWRTGDTQKRTTTYNDTVYMNLQASNVDADDVVEFRYVVHQVANENFRGDYFGNVAYLQRAQPIALSRYAVIYPQDWDLHFREPTLPHRRADGELPDGSTAEGERVTFFELRDVPRIYSETDQPGFADVYDHIVVSNKESYDEIGRWWWNLIEEQLVVDDEIRSTVANLIEGWETDAEIVEVIYDFVARNTRYLHLGLGIHGWKPYRTSTILRNRYGDCKDKAALLKVMLEEAGVDAEMVLVRTRRLGSVGDFPASMHVFNHAVTYVPSMDLFLDATAEFNGPYELTSMDQGAQALIISDGGDSRWVTMPIDDASDNLFKQTLEIDLSADPPVLRGTLEAHGAHAVRLRRSLEDPERRDERFERQLASTFPGIELIDAEYFDLDSLLAPTRIEYTATAPGILRGGEDGQALYPYAVPRDVMGAYAREATRHQDRTFRVPFANEAHLRYRLPSGQAIERVPDDRQVSSPFGDLYVEYRREGDELVVDLEYSIAVQRVSVADYEEFREFISEVHEALNETIRLVEEEGAS